MRVQPSFALGGFLLARTTLVQSIDLDVKSVQSILSASKTIAASIVDYFNQNDIPGLVADPYYWWESGLALDSLINYYSASGDNSVVKTVQDGMLWQAGPDNDFMPPNQTKSLGNSDQATWALAAMTAAENGFPQRGDQNVTWLQLATNVFNSQVLRWDTTSCQGGLRWQIFTFNNGYSYKNSVSQGSFAQLAARLARYTGNSTYADWAEKATRWTIDVGLINPNTYAIFDGTSATTNCSAVNHIQWTQDTGLFLGGGAYALNATNSQYWSSMITPLVDSTKQVFTKNDDNILYEVACAPSDNCNTDQLSFRAILARGLANAKDLAADSSDNITPILQASAQGAAAQCSGGNSGSTCGSDWTAKKWDGTSGLGQEISAMEIILANLPPRQLNSLNATAVASPGSTNGTLTATANETNTSSGPATSQTGGAAGLMSSSIYGVLAVTGLIGSLVIV